MRRKDVIRLIKRVIAIILVAVMTASVLTSYDRAGQFFNSVKTVFADEIEGEGEDDNSYIIDTEAPDTLETEPSYNEDCIDSDIFEDTTGSSESEPAEDEPENTGTFEKDSTNEDIGLIQREVKAEGEDIFVSGLLPSDAKVTAERVEVEVSGVKVIAAYDIKVFDKDGNEWQPAEPLKISVASEEVNKAVEDETQVIFVPDDLAESGKPVDIMDTNVERIDAVVKDGNVEFQAGHFSVYVIIEHAGGEVVTPRVQFHFIAPVTEDYQPENINGLFVYSSSPYLFNNKAADPQATNKQNSMIVRDGDTLESIEAPMNTQSTYFYGWYTVDKSDDTTYNSSTNSYSGGVIKYSWPLNDPGRVELDKTVSVSAVRSGDTITAINWTVGNVSGTCTDVDSEGCAHVYLAPIYSNYYFVNFHLGAHTESTAETLLSRKLIVLGNSNQTEVKVSDVSAPSNDPVHIVFIGWEQNIGTEQDPDWELIRTIDTNNQAIIDPGKDGKYITVGAKTVDLYPYFVQARYINFNIGPSGNGALFLGPQLIFTSDKAEGSDMYALSSLPTTTRNGYSFEGWYTGADGTGHQITDYNGDIIDDNYVVNGSYMGTESVAYEVKDGKLYAYNALDEVTFYAKWVANTNTTYKVVIWKQKVTDAVDATEKTYDYETYYYDDEWNSGNPVTESVLRNFSGKNASGNAVTNTNLLGMTFEGFEFDRYDYVGAVDPQGSTVINVYYNRKVYTFTFQDHYYETTSNNSPQYGVVNNKYQQIYYRNNAWRLTNNNNGTVYTGSRYINGGNNTWYNATQISALSGQDISSYFPIKADSGVIYNSGERWKATSYFSEVLVIIKKIPNADITFRLDTSTNSTKTMNYYVEVLPDETPEITYGGIGYKLHGNPVNANYGFITEDEDFLEIEGFTKNGSNPAFVNGKISNASTANFYYIRNKYNLTFSANYPNAYKINEPDAQVIGNVPYEQPLTEYKNTAAPPIPSNDYVFDGWYEDAAGVKPFDFAHETMPSANKVIYAKWSLKEYQININPNGGVISSIDYSWFTTAQLNATGLDASEWNGYATYFDNLATQTIESYDNLNRNYVEVSDAEAAQMNSNDVYRYVYIYRSNLEGGQGKLGAQARTTVYIRDTEPSLQAFYEYYVHQVELRQSRDPDLTPLPRAQWEATYVSTEKYRELRSGEQYVFLAWYEVVNGVRQNTPYDFSQPAEHETTLIAEWRLDGGYSILYTTEYYADNNDYITANLEDWTDPLDGTSKYADGATTQAMQEPTSVTVNGKSSEDAEYVDYQFLGWQIVKVETVAGRPRYTPLEPGVYYTAGQDLTVRARYSDANMVIHMQAVYQRRDQAHRRPDVVNLTLDASKDAINAGTGSVDSTLVDSLPAWAWPGHYWADDTHIYFGDTQSNTAVHLYKYATTLTESEETNEPLTPPGVNVFKHSEGYKLIGFDLDSPDTDFVPDYPADAVIAVSPGDEHTLYAVWEPMVYLTVKNDTNVGPVTFTVSGTAQAIRVVNQTDGSFSRTALNPNQGITLAVGESVRLVIPYGDGEKITISGTNTLGTGYWLNAKSELGFTNPVARTLSGSYFRVPNTETFSFTDEEALITHAEGVVITFTAEKAPHTLVLDDNYTGGATREVTFSETSSGVVFYQDESIPSFTLPSTSTRIGWELLGWDESPVATSPAYTTGVWTITNLTAFFTSNGSSTADLEVKTLYAIWKSNADASTVYVWKNVPEPGDQTKDYTFAVSFGGGFRYTESESYTSGWFLTRYRWKSSQTTGTISTSTAYNNTATLTYDFTLKHNQYLKIVTEKNETNQNGVRPSLKMSVTKWQRSSDGSPDMQIGNVTELIWNWTNTITITNDPDKVGLYKDFSFQNLNLSVTEADYTSRYDLDVEVAAQTTNAGLTVNNQNRQLYWTDTFAGGTVIFTNTRKTADVTINKSLLPVTADPELFRFTAEVVSPANETITYTLDPSTYTILSGADAANGGEWKIEGIPTGSTLIVTENLTAADINRFETSASGIKNAVSGISPVTDTAPEDNIFSFVVEDNTTVTFTNTLRTQNIRLVVMDDSVPPEYLDSANFTFPGVFEGTKFSAAGTGLVWEGTVFVGEYDLTETSMPDHAGVRYTKLQATATVNVNSDGVVVTPGAASDTIRVLYNDINDVYTIIVVNPKMQRVTIKKTVENDYGINNSFLFTITVTDSNDQPIQLSNVHGTQGTNAQGKLEFTLVNNQTALLYVPRYANVRIDETVDDRYITAYQTGDSADSLGAAVIGTSTTLSNITSDKYVLCNNQRQLVNVSVAKTVVGNGDTFTFTAQIKENNTAVTNYTLSNNGTPGDTSDDIVTDSEGVATFTLTVADNGTAAITFTVHKGMAVNVTEGQGTTVKYNTVYSVVCADGFSKDGQGNSTGFVTANADTNISFTNTEASVVAPTAVKSESMNLVILMISSSTCLAGAVVHNERKKKGGQDVSRNDE